MIVNRQHRVRVPVATLEEFLVRACRAARVAPELLTVCLVSNPEISKWNRAYRRKSGPTDVLSFPANANGNHGPRPPHTTQRGCPAQLGPNNLDNSYLGDIAIAPLVARRNAARFGRAFDDEMRILILHGILHLMGYDHETDNGQMDRRERRLRRALGLA
jgi:probable rRNA maturation factor